MYKFIALVALLGVVPALVVSSTGQPAGSEALVAKLKALRPDLPIERVHVTPMNGIYALELPDGSMLHGTADGKYLFGGDMYELAGEVVNLSEVNRAGRRKALLDELTNDDMVVFSPDAEPKASIYIFTDVDCGYCRKLHQEMADINELGIEVRYLAYPRAGVGSDSYRKIVSAWCADDKQTALTDLKAGRSIKPASCANPVAAQYDLGRALGISGTPAILTEDGQLYPGYVPAAQLAARLGVQ